MSAIMNQLKAGIFAAFVMGFSLFFAGEALYAQDGVPSGTEFRTEEDDLNQLEEVDEGALLSVTGALRIPFEVDEDCQASLALYTPEDRLVRILGQVVRLNKGQHRIYWDGLDLFGNLVPAGTELQLKVVMNSGLKAFYEFTVGHAHPRQPWGAKVAGDGLNQIFGGWLGDHSAPNAATAIGDYVVLGSFLVEYGSNVIMVDLEGNKIWGEQIAGWTGPVDLDSDGSHVYALIRGNKSVYRFDPFIADRRDRSRNTVKISSGKDEIIAIAAHDGRLYYAAKNHEAEIDNFRRPRLNINNAAAEPQVLETQAPIAYYTISPQAAFNSTFTGSGNPQAGITLLNKDGSGFAVIPFNQEVQFGSMVFSKMPQVEKLQLFALKQGLEYKQMQHSPLRQSSGSGGMDDLMMGGGGGDDLLGGMDFSEFDPNWELVGETVPSRRMNIVAVKDGYINTEAIYIRAVGKGDAGRGDNTIRLNAARVAAEPFRRLEAPANVTVFPESVAVQSTGASTAPGWKVRSKQNVSSASPVKIILDFGREIDFDGIMLLNPVNDNIDIQRYSNTAGFNAADDAKWHTIGRLRGKTDRYLKSLFSSKDDRTHIISTGRPIKTRALRFIINSGYKTGRYASSGRGGEPDDNPRRVECDEVALLKLNNKLDIAPAFKLVSVNGSDGKLLSEILGDDLEIQEMRFAPGGQLYAVMSNRLFSAEISERGLIKKALSDVTFGKPCGMAVAEDMIAVGDSDANAVYLFDHSGRELGKLGGSEKVRMPGAWQSEQIAGPEGLAIDSAGKIWVAEQQFAPKRVARFTREGKCEKEFFGPPMYGGGGSLDPNLKSFYYRGMEFSLDFKAGESRLKAKNDAVYWANEMTPTLENSSFSFTSLDKPVYYGGRRYIAGGSGGGTVVTIKDDNSYTWKPAAVIGPAHNSVFLKKELWGDHFAAMDLVDSYFIWCDHNDDGTYQIEEVELFTQQDWEAKGGEGRPPAGGAFGPGLSLWGSKFRLKPAEFTAGGVPIYRFADFELFDYNAIAPHYPRNYTLGGPQSAKPQYGGFKLVMQDGSLIQEGQPYIVRPDGTIKGGPVDVEPSDYLPEINGQILNQPWRFAGSAVSRSAVGEVAAVNSNNGYWYLWGGELGMILGAFFDGSQGSWNSGLRAERGIDVTGRKHDWEGWGSYFVRADDGNCYTVAGKGFHGICRIEGVDDFRVKAAKFKVPAAAIEYNRRLRPVLRQRSVARGVAMGRSSRKYCWPENVDARGMRFGLDGEIEEWGNRANMHRIGPESARIVFDLACTENELLVAFAGQNKVKNPGSDWRKMFNSGFAFEINIRTDGKNRSRDPVAGDRRIVFSKIDGEWRGVLYDYTPGGRGESLRLNSHYATVNIADVRKLTKEECRIAMREDTLGLDIFDLDASDEWMEEAPSLDGGRDKKPERPEGYQDWTAEIAIPWKTLDVSGPGNMRVDFGVHNGPDKAGKPGKGYFWSNQATETLGDEALAALINPAAWGFMGKPK